MFGSEEASRWTARITDHDNAKCFVGCYPTAAEAKRAYETAMAARERGELHRHLEGVAELHGAWYAPIVDGTKLRGFGWYPTKSAAAKAYKVASKAREEGRLDQHIQKLPW